MLSASRPSRSTRRGAVASTASAPRGWRTPGGFFGARHGGAGMAAADTSPSYLTRTVFVDRTVFVENEQRSKMWAVLAVVLAAEVMDLLDATIIAIAGPSIRADLGGAATGTAFLQWLAAGYTLAFAVGLVTGGRLGDIFGRRRMFLVGSA